MGGLVGTWKSTGGGGGGRLTTGVFALSAFSRGHFCRSLNSNTLRRQEPRALECVRTPQHNTAHQKSPLRHGFPGLLKKTDLYFFFCLENNIFLLKRSYIPSLSKAHGPRKQAIATQWPCSENSGNLVQGWRCLTSCKRKYLKSVEWNTQCSKQSWKEERRWLSSSAEYQLSWAVFTEACCFEMETPCPNILHKVLKLSWFFFSFINPQ